MRIESVLTLLGKTILRWFLATFVLVAYLLIIVAPICNLEITKNTFLGYMVAFPVLSNLYFGLFLLLYTAIRYKDYESISFIKNITYHLLSYTIFFFCIRILQTGNFDFFLDGKLFEYLYMVAGMILYFSIHILVFKLVIRINHIFSEKYKNGLHLR